MHGLSLGLLVCHGVPSPLVVPLTILASVLHSSHWSSMLASVPNSSHSSLPCSWTGWSGLSIPGDLGVITGWSDLAAMVLLTHELYTGGLSVPPATPIVEHCPKMSSQQYIKYNHNNLIINKETKYNNIMLLLIWIYCIIISVLEQSSCS